MILLSFPLFSNLHASVGGLPMLCVVLTAHQPQARLRPLTFSTESVQSYKPQSVNSRNLFRSCLMKPASVPEATPPSVTKNLEETAETAKCKPEWTDCQPAHREQIYESLTVLEITFGFFRSKRMGRLPPRGRSGSSVLGKASFFFSAAREEETESISRNW